MYYLPRNRSNAQDRGWVRLGAADMSWPIPGDAFWRIVGAPDLGAAGARLVYRRPLHFYASDPPAFLLAIDAGVEPEAAGDRVAYLVQLGTELFPLTGGSTVIHELNERLGGPRAGFELDYVEFFCSFVAGDDGPFLVPRSNDERAEVVTEDAFAAAGERSRARLILGDGAAGTEAAADAAATPSSLLVALVDAERAAALAAAAGSDAGGERTFLARAHVIYGNAVFAAVFALEPGGAIEMIDDTPLAPLQTVTRHRFVVADGSSWLAREWGGRQRQRITAHEFLERAYVAADAGQQPYACPTLRHLEVEGDVVFPSCRPLPWLHCQEVDFRGSVLLDDCQAADRVEFEACRVFGSFSARRAIFDKSLALRRCEILALNGGNGRPASSEHDRWGWRDFGAPVGLCLESARIETDLDLERTTCHATLRARRLVVKGNTSLAGLRALPAVVALPGATAPEPRHAASSSPVVLDLGDSELGGSLSLNCAFDHTAMAQMGASARHCHRPVVVGQLRLDGLQLQGSLWLAGLGVLCPAATRGGEVHQAGFSMRQARIAGGLQNYEVSASVGPPPTRILGEADLHFTQFGNYAHLDGFFITGDLGLGALTAQSVSLRGAWNGNVAADADYGGAEPWFDYTAGHADPAQEGWRPCYVGGDVNLNNARISGTVFAGGVRIAGSLRAMDGACLGSLRIRPMLTVVVPAAAPGDPAGGRGWTLQRHRPRLGGLRLETATINGTLCLQDAEVGADLGIVSTSIAGNVDLYGFDELRLAFLEDLQGHYTWNLPAKDVAGHVDSELRRALPSTAIGHDGRDGPGALRMAGSSIGGSVDLRNASIAGDLLLVDSRLAGDLATAPELAVGGLQERADQIQEGGQRALMPILDLEGCRAAVLEVHGHSIDELAATPEPPDLGELTIRTRCKRLVFDALDCRGDARLWRLVVSESVSGKHAEIGGRLSFHVAPRDPAGVMESAVARGSGAGGRRVNLERASFAQLTLVEPFPREVRLRGIRVEQWSPSALYAADAAVEADAAAGWERKAGLMLKLLDRMPEVEPAVYLDVERHFRASGQDELADRIYCALRDRLAVAEEAATGAASGLWLWLGLLAIPLALVALQAGLVPGMAGVPRPPLDAITVAGLVVGLLAPWVLAYVNPPRSAEPPAADGRAAAAGTSGWRVPARLVRGLAVIVVLAGVFLCGTLRTLLAIAALAFWTHVVLLLPLVVASRRVRSLVFGRLMLRLGTGHGTAAYRLVLAWLVLLLLPMAVVLHEPRNIEPSLMAQGTLKVPADAHPDAAAWRWHWLEPPPTWVWMAVEATVPIISLGAEDKWESADRPPAVLACVARGAPAGGCRDIVIPLGASAKQVEDFLRLIGWVFWPLAAAGFAASFIHRRQASG